MLQWASITRPHSLVIIFQLGHSIMIAAYIESLDSKLNGCKRLLDMNIFDFVVAYIQWPESYAKHQTKAPQWR